MGADFYFHDELRFGTRTDLGRRWSPKGVKPVGHQHIGYDYGYLSVAINPITGDVKMLILPNMTKESFQVFLDEFAEGLKEEAILITDGATAHRSKNLKPGEKINLELLPAYSPQLNPVERFFLEVRRRLKNRVFITYEEVEKAVIEIAKSFMTAKEAIKKLTCYDWLINTPS